MQGWFTLSPILSMNFVIQLTTGEAASLFAVVIQGTSMELVKGKPTLAQSPDRCRGSSMLDEVGIGTLLHPAKLNRDQILW